MEQALLLVSFSNLRLCLGISRSAAADTVRIIYHLRIPGSSSVCSAAPLLWDFVILELARVFFTGDLVS